MMEESKQYTNSIGGTYWKSPAGRYHREDGPAVIWKDGTQIWFKYGKRHRLDGPAIIWADGHKEWCINDHHVTDKIKKWAKEMNIDLANLTDEDKMLIRIYWENYDEDIS